MTITIPDQPGQLWLINCDDTVKEIFAAEYGPLKYKCPQFNKMKELLDIQTIEHVSVLYQDQHCHMFVDEMGHLQGDRTPNPKATRLYWNATNRRTGRPASLIYDDITEPPGVDQRRCTLLSHWIVGPALLWTGDME